MITKEDAEKFVNKFYSRYNNVLKEKGITKEQKRIALIAVEEVIMSHEMSVHCENLVLNHWIDMREKIKNLPA
jgi:hypothetical protein